MAKRNLAFLCDELECDRLLEDWRWLVPDGMEPLMVGIFGDWVFAAPDATHWHLDLLEGKLHKIAEDSHDFNSKKEQLFYRNEWFGEEWANIALSNGLVPKRDECLGWKVAPVLGGDFTVENIQVFSLNVYQRINGSLFRQIAAR
ncbi:T6SS immunity protein Tdi1 domain-containing protein [Tateyamaria sp.]|uniref:T6SS immunity protein Tdi1 domain-containing protein n=1 Tax=Tateyamaria sp. TaxID=1929288 RepID=UPI00329C7908